VGSTCTSSVVVIGFRGTSLPQAGVKPADAKACVGAAKSSNMEVFVQGNTTFGFSAMRPLSRLIISIITLAQQVSI
jgi:hypothetical protein